MAGAAVQEPDQGGAFLVILLTALTVVAGGSLLAGARPSGALTGLAILVTAGTGALVLSRLVRERGATA